MTQPGPQSTKSSKNPRYCSLILVFFDLESHMSKQQVVEASNSQWVSACWHKNASTALFWVIPPYSFQFELTSYCFTLHTGSCTRPTTAKYRRICKSPHQKHPFAEWNAETSKKNKSLVSLVLADDSNRSPQSWYLPLSVRTHHQALLSRPFHPLSSGCDMTDYELG